MTDLATAKHLLDRRKTPYNKGLAKVAVQCSAGTFVVNQTFVPRINPPRRMVKIANFF